MLPGYIKLLKRGELDARIEKLELHYTECALCPHQCKINRLKGEQGICRSGPRASVASYNAHHGEEPPISGSAGSGTIFFAGCSGRCNFCQNYPISQLNNGISVSENRLAEMMLELQNRGCHNINFVTPTHFLPSIIRSISNAAKKGLRLPLVYNSGGYERIVILKLLNGIIDIYLPDAKYADNKIAFELSGFREYTLHNQNTINEMHRQVGDLRISAGVGVKGLIVRHLILPDNLSGTDAVMQFLSRKVSRNLYVSFMDQYFPAYKALHDSRIARRITREEYDTALDYFEASGLHNGWIQEHIAG